jgi:hypothetical protein
MSLEYRFSIPLSGTVTSEGGAISIKIDGVQTFIELPSGFVKAVRHKIEGGMRLSDIVLESALLLKNSGVTQFTGADLLHMARTRHPNLNQRSFWSQVIASAPNHPSAKHFKKTRRYLRYINDGRYMLESKYNITHDPGYEEGVIDESLWSVEDEQ